MYNLIRKIHTYVGLLNFSNLIVFGIAGLAPTLYHDRQSAVTPVRYENYTPPPGASNKQIADAAFLLLHSPLTEPIPNWALHPDAQGNLPLDFYSVNGTGKVLYLAKESRFRIQEVRSSLAFFLDDMHTVTDLKQADWRMKMWACYNHFAIWSLLAMSVSGVYLWLASRPRYRIAQYAFAVGAGVFILLYVLTR